MPQEPKKPNYKIQETEISRKRREKENNDTYQEGLRDFEQHRKSTDSLRVERSKLPDPKFDDSKEDNEAMERRKKFRAEAGSLNAEFDERSDARKKKMQRHALEADRWSRGGGR